MSIAEKRRISRTILAFFAAVSLWAAPGSPAWAVTSITLEECLEIAEEYHPTLAGSAAAIAADRGRLKQAAVADRLTVSGTLSQGRSGNERAEDSSFSAGASANLKVFDSNRTKYSIEAQSNTLAATQENARQTLLDIRTGVKSAYMSLLLNKEIAVQREESVQAYARHLEQATGFYEAGSKPWYDVTKAQVDLGNARLALVEAEANIETAKAELLNAMGVSIEEDFDVLPVAWNISENVERGAERTALENRADFKAAVLKIDAGRATLGAEARNASPTVSLSGGYNGGGSYVGNLDRDWNIGLKMSIPIVDGGETKARVETAQAQLDSLEATHEKLRQDILLDVRKTATDLKKARERIRLSEITLVNAEENRRLAEGRYETGVGDALEVTDALLSLTEAQLTKYQALHDLRAAAIDLEKATGKELFEVAAAENEERPENGDLKNQ